MKQQQHSEMKIRHYIINYLEEEKTSTDVLKIRNCHWHNGRRQQMLHVHSPGGSTFSA